MADKKLTKRDYFNAIKVAVADNADYVAFIDHEIELLDKKAAKSKDATRKPTKNQVANESLKADFLNYVASADKAVTIKDIAANFDLSSQKVTPLMTALVNDGKVAKSVDKRTSYFTVA